MKIKIGSEKKAAIQEGMIGLFFEDINYAADGGLYAELLENRSFEFVKATGDARDYQVEYDGSYAWSVYPAEGEAGFRCITGSPHTEENPHYLRLQTKNPGEGICNKAYDGIFLKKGTDYMLTFWVRSVKFSGNFDISIEVEMSTLSPNAALSLLLTPWTSPRRGTSVFPWSVWIFRVSLLVSKMGCLHSVGKHR